MQGLLFYDENATDKGMEIKTIKTGDGIELAYEHLPGTQPGVMFLGGYRSDMEGTKVLAIRDYCEQTGRQFTRFDYRGHGKSGGEFIDATVGAWLHDVLTVLDNVTIGAQVLVGSSMGGHMMCLAALQRPEKVAALFGVASAPDFTEKLMWERGGEKRQKQLQEEGVIYLPSDYSDEPYPITYRLIEEGRNHLILDNEIAIDCPVVLTHGVLDEDVPWEFSMLLAAQLRAEQVDILIRKDADHRLSRQQDIVLIVQALDDLLVELVPLEEKE